MKKFFCLLIALIVIWSSLSGICAFASDGQVVFRNAETAAAIQQLDGADMVSADVTVTLPQSGTISLIAAHYTAQGALSKMEFIHSGSGTAGETVTLLTPEISVSGTEVLKVFAWSGTDTLVPLMAPGEIQRYLLQPLPTATVSELDTDAITEVPLTLAMNFIADPVTDAQLDYYGDWYADFELKLNKDATFHLDGTKDGYLAGQYDGWSPAWVTVPKKDVTITANTPLKIMETGAEAYGEPGLKYTYREVYEKVKNFDCGVYFDDEFLLANPDLVVTLELRMYHPEHENISYTIGETYTYQPEIPLVEKFQTKFVNHETYLYRVGNQNTVTLGSLFEAIDGVEVGSVSAAVVPMENTPDVSATYTANSDWTKGTLQFTGTGVVSVTISDETSNPYTLYLEVVDAKNVTAAANATANNVVLLNDISGGFTVSNGYAFYGNGFTVTCSGNGAVSGKNLALGYITVSLGGILDNVKVICDIFPESYLYTSDITVVNNTYPYSKSAVTVSGNSTISNCYIYGARNNIYVGGGNVTIKNTVTECGSLANLHLTKSSDAYTVTLDNVTTIQYPTTSGYDTSKTVMGLGVAVGDADTKANPYIRLQGDFLQYNWVTSEHSSVSNEYAKSIISAALGESAYTHTINGKTTVNLGIAYLNSYPANIMDERDNKASIPYELNKVTILGATGRVYSVAAGSAVSENFRYDPQTDGVIPYSGGVNGLYQPQIRPDATLGGQYIANTDGCNEYCYLDSDTLKIMVVAGDEMAVDLSKIFTFQKYTGQNLNVQISCVDSDGNSVALNGNTITFFEIKDYTVTYTLTDTIFYTQNGEAIPQTVIYQKELPVTVTLKDISVPDAYFQFDSSKQVIYYNKALLGDKVQFMPFLAGLKIYDYIGETEYLRFDGDDNAYQKVVSATIENLNTTGQAAGYHIITVKLVDGGVLKIDLDVKATSGGSTNTGSIKTNNNIFYVVNDGGTANSGQIWRVYDYEFTGNNGVVINSGAVTFGTSGTDASSATKPTGTFSATVSATVNYDAMGGICAQAVGYQTNYYSTLTLPYATRPGYLFAGWYTAPQKGTRIGGIGDSYTPSGDVTLYAQWGIPGTVTYHAMGGTVTPETVDYSGAELTLPLPQKDGYWFTGWYTDEACIKLFGQKGEGFHPKGDTALYAGWSPIYTVTYHANGGSVSIASQTYEGVALSLPLATDSARAFAGWYTQADGGSFVGMGGDAYIPNQNITLYAQWEEPTVITYDGNGGTVSTASQTYMGTPLTLPTASRSGYNFAGWYTQASGGTKIGDAGASYTPTENITLYAQWTGCVVTYNANSGSCSTASQTYAGTALTLPTATRSSYTFNGWYTQASGGTKVGDAGASYTPTADITLYAQWKWSGCVTPDTLVTMADGSKKEIQHVSVGDEVLAWNFHTGAYEAVPLALAQVDGSGYLHILHLYFEDGTELKVLGEHGIYDADLNTFIFIDEYDVRNYLGHRFVKQNSDSYTTVKLLDYSITAEDTKAYTVLSVEHYNVMLEDMWTVTPAHVGENFFNPFTVGEGMKYDEEAVKADILKYGLYTYEEFDHVLTYEQFLALNIPQLKVSVGKGLVTYDGILYLIEHFINR